MRRFPEHVLQTQVSIFCREAIDVPHSFQAHDRSANRSGTQHLWEANRGIRKGQPDTLLLCAGAAVFCELKAPGNEPTDAQYEMGREIQAAGGHWFWANSVTGYMAGLETFGVPLRANARLIAEHREGLFQSYLLKGSAPAKPRKASRPRAPKPTLAQVRRMEAVRRRIAF